MVSPRRAVGGEGKREQRQGEDGRQKSACWLPSLSSLQYLLSLTVWEAISLRGAS